MGLKQFNAVRYVESLYIALFALENISFLIDSIESGMMAVCEPNYCRSEKYKAAKSGTKEEYDKFIEHDLFMLLQKYLRNIETIMSIEARLDAIFSSSDWHLYDVDIIQLGFLRHYSINRPLRGFTEDYTPLVVATVHEKGGESGHFGNVVDNNPSKRMVYTHRRRIKADSGKYVTEVEAVKIPVIEVLESIIDSVKTLIFDVRSKWSIVEVRCNPTDSEIRKWRSTSPILSKVSDSELLDEVKKTYKYVHPSTIARYIAAAVYSGQYPVSIFLPADRSERAADTSQALVKSKQEFTDDEVDRARSYCMQQKTTKVDSVREHLGISKRRACKIVRHLTKTGFQLPSDDDSATQATARDIADKKTE